MENYYELFGIPAKRTRGKSANRFTKNCANGATGPTPRKWSAARRRSGWCNCWRKRRKSCSTLTNGRLMIGNWPPLPGPKRLRAGSRSRHPLPTGREPVRLLRWKPLFPGERNCWSKTGWRTRSSSRARPPSRTRITPTHGRCWPTPSWSGANRSRQWKHSGRRSS